MKKRLLMFMIVAIVFIGAAVGFASCDKAKDVINDIRVEEVENISYDNGFITWNKVNADYYTVSINKGEPQRSNSTTFAYDSKGETFEVTIVSVLGESTATASKTFIPLAPVDADLVNVSDDGKISWEAVSGANAYLITVNGQQVASPVTDTVYEDLKVGSNRVKIKPVVSGDSSYYSSWSSEINVYIYAAPTALRYDGTTLSWSGNAQTYMVTVNGVSKTVNGNYMEYNSGNKDFDVEVKAIGNHTSTYDSAALKDSYYYLDPVTNITVTDGILTWDEVKGAEGYRISVDGVVQGAKLTENSYALVSGKSLRVKLMPYNESGNYFSSWTNEQTFYILNTPVAKWNSSIEPDGEAKNNFYWDSDSTYGFTVKLERDGHEPEIFSIASATSFEYAYSEVGVYKVSVKANAQAGDATKFDSAYSKPIIVERLAAPTQASNNFITSDPDNLAKGFTVNFVGVTGATKYRLYKEGSAVENAKETTGSSMVVTEVVDGAVVESTPVNYSIRSIGGVKTVGGSTYVTLSSLSSKSLSFTVTVSAMPENLTMAGFDASWNTVSGANGYAVAYGNTTVAANENKLDLSSIQPGTYDVKVCTRGNGGATLASNYTSAIKVQRLNAPYDIKIIANDGNGLLQYSQGDVISGFVAGYTAYIGTESTAIGQDKFDEMYNYIMVKGTALSMTADANQFNSDNTVYYMTSPRSATKMFIRLAAPKFSEGAISSLTDLVWEASDNINTAVYTPSYQLVINDTANTESVSTRYSLTGLAAGDYRVTVKAIGNGTQYLDSEMSETFTFTKLATPDFAIENNCYVWNADARVTSYALEIDGERVKEGMSVAGSKYSYKPRYTSLGDHSVKLYAVGNGVDTVSSNAYNFTQKISLLSAPEFEITGERIGDSKGGTVTVTLKNAVANASGYQYEVGGTSEYSNSASFTKKLESDGKCNVRVKSVGGVIDANGVYYLDSNFSQTKTLTFLPSVNSTTFSINGNGQIMWGSVSSAQGYDYQIKFDDGAWSDITHANGSSVLVENYKNYKHIYIRVRTSSNNTPGYVDSVWTEWVWTNNNA